MKKKLSLKKVTVSNLTEGQLGSIKGGEFKTQIETYTNLKYSPEALRATVRERCTRQEDCTKGVECERTFIPR